MNIMRHKGTQRACREHFFSFPNMHVLVGSLLWRWSPSMGFKTWTPPSALWGEGFILLTRRRLTPHLWQAFRVFNVIMHGYCCQMPTQLRCLKFWSFQQYRMLGVAPFVMRMSICKCTKGVLIRIFFVLCVHMLHKLWLVVKASSSSQGATWPHVYGKLLGCPTLSCMAIATKCPHNCDA